MRFFKRVDYMMKKRLRDQVAIITGSTYGIGESIAKVLSDEGAVSIVTGRSADEGEKTVSDIVKAGGKAEYHKLDVTDEENISDMTKAVFNKYGRIDILVNNAGVSGPNKPVHEYSRSEWEWVFDVIPMRQSSLPERNLSSTGDTQPANHQSEN